MPDNDSRLSEELMGILRAAARDALVDVGEDIVRRAKADLPKGDPEEDPNPALRLRDAFSMEWTGKTLVIRVTSPYAIKQHESFYLRHPRGGSPKFLERQFATAGLELEKELGVRVRTYLAGGTRMISHDAAAVQKSFAAAGIHSVGDYVERFYGVTVRPGSGQKVK